MNKLIMVIFFSLYSLQASATVDLLPSVINQIQSNLSQYNLFVPSEVHTLIIFKSLLCVISLPLFIIFSFASLLLMY